MDEIPFIAVGYDELAPNASISKGDMIECKHCGRHHEIRQGREENGDETSTLQFYTCGETTYLAGIQGRTFKC